MPQVIVTRNAANDLARLRDFLKDKNLEAANRIGRLLDSAMKSLGNSPERGREDGYKRILIVHPRRSRSSYLIAYRYVKLEPVYVLAIRHSRERGWSFDASTDE